MSEHSKVRRDGVVMSHEIVKWPEWERLCDRLGIDSQKERMTRITAECGEPVLIEREHYGQDALAESEGE